MQRQHDRVLESSTSTGTGNITLLGAVTQYKSFASRWTPGSSEDSADPFYYAIKGQTGSEWEVGVGYLADSTTLVRVRVFESSNGDALVSFAAGTKDVFNTIPSARIAATFTQGQAEAKISGMAMP